MRFWMIVFLVVLMPLQLSWAATVGYDQHEQDVSSKHIGHHMHQHDRSADKSNDTGAQIDPDCGFCHLSFSSFVPALSPMLGDHSPPQLVASPVAEFRSTTVDPFDRPPLARLA